MDRYRGDTAALFTDLYELKMAQALWAQQMTAPACFSLFFRKLPTQRNFLLACGLHDVLEFLERLRFSEADVDYLASLHIFSRPFLEYLEAFRFTGDVYAVPEGTPVFPNEPLLEVVAPAPEAQLVETWALNQVHAQTVLASKAARVVAAACGRPVFDFGARRIHGADGAVKAARAFYLAGVAGTSNVLAGRRYGIPVSGTMAHSYIQAHAEELDAFRNFVHEFPATILLVDTYDTLQGVERVIALAEELGREFQVRGVRLDSGDLLELSRATRSRLDAAGLGQLQIVASGGLGEHAIAALVAAEAPIDAFGVGTDMGASVDAPTLDMVYKLVAYGERGCVKLSPGKQTLPGRKQVWRQYQHGSACGDVVVRADEVLEGVPLLVPVMKGGRRLAAAEGTLPQQREYCQRMVQELPGELSALAPAATPYPIELSQGLQRLRDRVVAECGPPVWVGY